MSDNREVLGLEIWVRVPDDERPRRNMRLLLNSIAIVAALDVLLLIPLVWASLTDNDGLISVLGPIHGFGFMLLVGMCVRGVSNQWWGWWYPLFIIVTLGPIGSLVGDLFVRRRYNAAVARS